MRTVEKDLAIVLLPDDEFIGWAESNRRGLAKNFPVHLTLKTRFAWRSSIEKLVSGISELLDRSQIPASLIGPHYIGSTIKWLECAPDCDGYDEILSLHHRCLDTMLSEQGGNFERDSFRPHVTLDWNENGILSPPATIQEKITCHLNFCSWAILSYPRNPQRKGVTQVFYRDFG